MKTILMVGVLMMVGCGYKYEVTEFELLSNPVGARNTYYSCDRISWIPFFERDGVLKVCSDLKQCNDFCEKRRNE